MDNKKENDAFVWLTVHGKFVKGNFITNTDGSPKEFTNKDGEVCKMYSASFVLPEKDKEGKEVWVNTTFFTPKIYDKFESGEYKRGNLFEMVGVAKKKETEKGIAYNFNVNASLFEKCNTFWELDHPEENTFVNFAGKINPEASDLDKGIVALDLQEDKFEQDVFTKEWVKSQQEKQVLVEPDANDLTYLKETKDLSSVKLALFDGMLNENGVYTARETRFVSSPERVSRCLPKYQKKEGQSIEEPKVEEKKEEIVEEKKEAPKKTGVKYKPKKKAPETPEAGQR